MKKITALIMLVLFNWINSQETIGLIYDDINLEKSEGYTLIKPTSDNRVLLINNCGELVNQWTISSDNARNVYLLENGNLLVSSGLEATILDWDNNVVWSIEYQATFGWRIHHDIEPLPNGNFLVLVRDSRTDVEMFAEGMDTSYSNPTFVIERIIEIEPVGTDTANIAWEWKMIDHIVQDFDNTKPNFGVVADNPQLYNINYDNGNGSNPIHANAIDYNPILDQIAVSSRHLSEVFILDHSTTTAEAATNSGGIYGKGGDFLWRWGNPEAYDRGTAVDRKLGRQHDIKWITDGPNQGKLSVFNNDGYGSDMTISSIHIIDQNDTNGVYSMDAGIFLPDDYFWSWDGTIMNEVMHAGAQCGLQMLPNGNALINESDIGRISEITSSGDIVWVYRIPVGNNTNFDQFAEPTGNGSFRAHRYPVDYPGFNGVTFNNVGILEDVNNLSDDCANRLSINDVAVKDLSVYPNPTKGILNFNSDMPLEHIEIYNITGKLVMTQSNTNTIDLEPLAKGMYMVKISLSNSTNVIKVIKE
ncbi:aryl-sulfate sulfotransferase [Winogradskyella sp.]|uniref:aryl-sulfate sulfotransferase n=1 Tax=Winogradskyella sp. TaxID=1883156 RepID=UPI0026310A30|nr:aryl-sulfate sulfotransferase [Winogradskyella sp.]